MTDQGPTAEDLRRENEELRRRLAEADQTIQALSAGQIDAIVDEAHKVPLLLHESQEALRASEERYRTIVTTAAEGIWMVDAQARTTFVNERMAAMLGYGPEEMLGRSMYDFMDEEARGTAVREFKRQESGIRGELDFSFRRKDGSIIWTRLATSPMFGSRGEFTGALAMVSDITERRQAEEARRRLAAIVDSSEDAILSKALDGTILTWNAGAERLYGYRADEVIGRDASLVVLPDREAEFQDSLEKIRSGQPVRHLETVRRRKDGTEVAVSLSMSPLHDASGRLVGASTIGHDISERRRLENARRVTEERFSKVFRESPIAIAIATADGAILDANRCFYESFGYRLEELMGRTPLQLGLWADPADRLRMVEALSHDGRVRNLEITFRRKSGETGAALLSAEPIELQEFGKSARLVMLTDVTERKRAEESLRATRAVLEQAQAEAHIGSWSSDPVHPGMVIWSREMLRIFGLEVVGFDGRFETFLSMVHPEDLPAILEADAASWRDGRTVSIDLRIVRLDGTVRWIHISADVVRDASGKPVELVGIAQDITDLRIATDRLRESDERYRILFDESPLPIVLFDPESFAITAVNELAVRQYGYTREELLSKTLLDLLPPEGVEAAKATVRSTKQWRGVRQHVKKGGGLLTVEVVSHPVVLAGREYRMAVMRDITNQMALEEQLRQFQKMEAVGRLAGGIAHDFNNILTVIGGYSEVLLKALSKDEPAYRHATEIGLAAKRAAALTRQLLIFSRKQVLEPKVLDLNTIVNGILEFLRRLLGEDIEIVLELQKRLGLVKADPGQIEQVIVNLAVNARDAMPHGGKLILETQDVELDEGFSRAHPSVAAGPYVLFVASDTGYGMAPETLSHIFEPFFTTKEVGKGTGLGLSTIFGIVKQSGGEVSVHSVPGEGTTFKIYLPRVSAETAERDQASPRLIFRVRTSQTVLMVEDDEAVARLTKSMLGDLGYEVLAARRGEEALEIATHHPGPIHLLLTDVVMPGLRGPEVATRLLAVRPETRVIFMSGYAAESMLHQPGVLGTATFLQKPFTSSSLGAKLQEALGVVLVPGPARKKGSVPETQQGPSIRGGRKPLSILHMDDDKDILEITRMFLADDGNRVVSCLDVDETVARYAEALARGGRFDLVLLDLSIPGKKGGVEGMREILKLDPTAKVVACSGAGLSEIGPLENGFIGIVEKPFTSESLKAILHLL